MFENMNGDDKFWLVLWGMVIITIIYIVSSVTRHNMGVTASENELVSKGYTKVYQCVPSKQLPVWSKDGKIIKVKD